MSGIGKNEIKLLGKFMPSGRYSQLHEQMNLKGRYVWCWAAEYDLVQKQTSTLDKLIYLGLVDLIQTAPRIIRLSNKGEQHRCPACKGTGILSEYENEYDAFATEKGPCPTCSGLKAVSLPPL